MIVFYCIPALETNPNEARYLESLQWSVFASPVTQFQINCLADYIEI